MNTRPFGRLDSVSALTLGGGGIGQVWGATSRAEAVATIRAATDAGVTLLDVAPSYGNGEAERAVGEAFEGRLPAGVRIGTKCHVGPVDAREVAALLERSLSDSLERLRLERVDLFFLHGLLGISDAPQRATPRALFAEAVRPALEGLVADGRAGAWAITGIGEPDAVIEALQGEPAPTAIQCITNLLDSAGSMRRFAGPARPRDIIAAAGERRIPVMGIRAVQAGALTDAFDRELPADSADAADYARAAPFRALARSVGEAPAALAHRYALSMAGVATVVLGVKNRTELRECIAAEERGPLDPALIAQIDATVGRT